MSPYDPVPLSYSEPLQQYTESRSLPYSSLESVKQPYVTPINEETKSAWYPKSIALVVLWISYIIGMIVLLEKAVEAAPHSVIQPWAYTVLPGLTLTLFAQGHLVITSIHLSRVGVSALHSPRTAPRSWAELYWLADGKWHGPMGIVTTLMTAAKHQTGLSLTFLAFALTCIIATATPIIFSRAYPVGTLDVLQNTTISPSTFSLKALLAIESYAQVGTGGGSWSTGLSIFESYNDSVYTPLNQLRGDTSDFFFAGSSLQTDTRLPGLRLQGGCQPYQNDSLLAVLDNTTFPTFCDSGVFNGSQAQLIRPRAVSNPWSVTLIFGACSENDYAFGTPEFAISTNTAYFYFISSNATNGPVTKGMVKCQSVLSVGDADVSGIRGTYEDFKVFPNTAVLGAQGGEPLEDPLAAVIYALNPDPSATDGSPDDTVHSTIVKQLGYNATLVGGSLNFTQPTMDIFADRVWFGVSHMTAGLGLLSRTSDTVYPAISHHTVSGRTRSPLFVKIAFALLGSWLLALLAVTAYTYRKTFAPSLNSYVAAHLSVKEGVLMEEKISDEPAENGRLRSSYSSPLAL
ncbi:hypothetical protein M422DRAFT_775228 [Sphaerobolus stellatus SS14]|nr:hypothetical protein M422DRAFT_775228 [Sphaerobolus stellatus SS14]